MDERRGFLERLDALIKENLVREDLNVSFLADRMCMSHSSLFRWIKKSTGMGGNEYIRNIRLEKAAECLKNGMGVGESVAISNVAFACGFSSLSSFAKAFRKRYGMSATEFLRSTDQLCPLKTSQLNNLKTQHKS